MRGPGLYILLLFLPTAGLHLHAQEVKELEKKVKEFTLANALHFIVLERHESPVVSFHTYVNAGGVQNPAGESGIAQLFERVFFKGTETIGTRNWPEEKKALDTIEDAYDRMDLEANKGIKADQTRVDMLRNQVRLASDNARRFGAPGEYRRIIEENGAIDMSSRTSPAATEYFYTLPSNRTELWFLMESQRLLRPVFRDFYTERDLLLEERRRAEANPRARLMAELLASAFQTHPYRSPPGGWSSDIQNLRRASAKAFYERYYVPGNITIAMVGDINPADAKRLAERYFGAMPARPMPPLVHAEDPPQNGPKSVIVEMPVQPMTAIAYKRPSQYDRDDTTLDVIEALLSQGRTAFLYLDLVQERRVAVQAQASSTFPDGHYNSLFLFFLVPGPGHTVAENEQALDELLAHFRAYRVDPQSLARAKAQGRANLMRRLASNRDLAGLLAQHHADYGDWRKLFASFDELDKVSAEDVHRVVNKYFVATGRTTASIAAPGKSNAPPPLPAPKPADRKTGGPQ